MNFFSSNIALFKKICDIGRHSYYHLNAPGLSLRFSCTKSKLRTLCTSLHNAGLDVSHLTPSFRLRHCSICGIHTTPALAKKRKTREERKAKDAITYRPRPKLKVVDVWLNMTVQELAKSLDKDVDHVFEAMEFVENSFDYDKPNSVIDRVQVIKDIVKKSGCKCVFVRNPAEEIIENKKNRDVARRPPPTDEKCLVPRPPVVTIMGHVDHGKTTLLDSLRHTSVVDQEFGGITQHIGAFTVKLATGSTVTFLDTPGHAAFTAMRARGASVTDIVVLVVAADDGVMPQTVESIQHAVNANVPIIVAINKTDKYNSNIEKSKKDLLQYGIMLEDFGGDVQAVPVSALKKVNLDLLVEAILAQAEMMHLKAEAEGLVEGYVIESRTDISKGRLATVLVQRGLLKKGACLVAGRSWAKVRELYDDRGQRVSEALPSMPVEVSGWKELPSAGDEVLQVESEGRMKEVINYRNSLQQLKMQEEDYEVIKEKRREHEEKYKAELTARRLQGRIKRVKNDGVRPKEIVESNTGPTLPIVLKGDVDGSVEAILHVLSTYHSPLLSLEILDFGVGAVTRNDVEMAKTFNGIIYAFNVGSLAEATKMAAENDVSIKNFNIIYRLFEDVKVEINARLPQVEQDEIIGEASVLREFLINERRTQVPVAGAVCTQGLLKKSELYRIHRGDQIIYEGRLCSLRHLKDEVEVVKKDVECGVRVDDASVRFEHGDRIVCLKKKWVPQTIQWNPGF